MSIAAGLEKRVNDAIAVGMMHAVWADLAPQRIAGYDALGGTRSFGDLNARGNQIARLLRAKGLGKGDAVALVCTNRVEFLDVLSGCLRAGVRVTPVNWHLTADEIAYIVNDCEAKALFGDERVEPIGKAAAQCGKLLAKFALGGRIDGFDDFEAAIAAQDAGNLSDPVRGHTMLYTSGTTGRPKGVFKPNAPPPAFAADYTPETDLHMCTGPAYHAAPLAGDVIRATNNGVGTVLLDKWDSELTLRTIEERKVTHSHMVAIMFQRLLSLPEDLRRRYDLSSLKRITHGAAPCPPEVKRAMIEWVGPKIREYYAGSEGGAGFTITSEEWLAKPGSVGKRPSPELAKIFNEAGEECAPGEAGTIYMRQPSGVEFEYYKDQEKTEANRLHGYFTLGDIGYFDEDGYLFLTGRSAETIISGGVNIYPQEVDNEIIKHPAVEDSCTIGAPNDEWGEEVRAMIQLRPGVAPSEALKQEIIAQAAANLARYKVPRSVEFVEELPRNAAGKVLRGKVRAPFWAGRARQI